MHDSSRDNVRPATGIKWARTKGHPGRSSSSSRKLAKSSTGRSSSAGSAGSLSNGTVLTSVSPRCLDLWWTVRGDTIGVACGVDVGVIAGVMAVSPSITDAVEPLQLLL